jgi:eukaryotic-like serine/threonine-protein kinase
MGHNVLKTEAIFQFGEFRVDPLDRTLRRNEAVVALNRRAFDVLLYLVRNPGRVVAKDELLKNVWPDVTVDENNLNQSISALRRALEERPGAHGYIATLPGRGYQFIMPVVAIERATGMVMSPELGQQPAGGVLVQQRSVTTRIVTEEQEPLGLRGTRSGRRSWRVMLTLAAIVVVCLAGFAGWRHLHPQPDSATVVVANFLNTTGDATFDRTLDRALEIDLGQSPYMDVMSEREVVSNLQYMGRTSDSALTADLARQICERSNREAVLTGSIAGVGSRYLLTLEATGCNSGKKLAAAKAEASSKEGVLAAVDSVADRVRSKLGESAKSVESYQVPTAKATTPSLEALKAYSMGDYLGAQGKDETETLPFFQKAVELDPQFAMAYGEIATDYYNLSEYEKASLNYARAFQLRDHVSAKEKLVLEAHYYAEGQGDLENGIKTYKVWAATYPNDWAPAVNLCNQYTQLGEYAPAIDAGRKALKMQPDRGITYSVLARALMRANRFDEARSVGEQAKQRGKDSAGLHGTLFDIAFYEHDGAALAGETKWAAAHNEGWYAWFFVYSQAAAAAAGGKYQEAVSLFRTAYETAEGQKALESADGVLLDQAEVETEFGLHAAALETLGRVGNRDTDMPDLAILYAELGDTTVAQRYLAKYGKQTSGTEMMYRSLPRVRAAVALEQGKPLDAVAALEPSRPYELGGYAILARRAAAYLKAGDGKSAAVEYRKILANPGIDPVEELYPLAHLGLARADALLGDTVGSRGEYAAFLGAFKDADLTLPVVKDALAEMAGLRGR